MSHGARSDDRAIFLGPATFFYNMSLGIYYKLVIVNGWRERRLRTIRFWLHAVPITAGLSLAFAGLPYYDWTPILCMTPYFPWGEQWPLLMALLIVPICGSLVVLTVLMTMIYLRVRSNYMKSLRYRYNDERSSKTSTQRRVFWQSLSYVAAFAVSWPIVMVGVIMGGIQGWLPLSFGMLLALLAPLQGFINALVYFRPRIGLMMMMTTTTTSSAEETVKCNTATATSTHESGAPPTESAPTPLAPVVPRPPVTRVSLVEPSVGAAKDTDNNMFNTADILARLSQDTEEEEEVDLDRKHQEDNQNSMYLSFPNLARLFAPRSNDGTFHRSSHDGLELDPSLAIAFEIAEGEEEDELEPGQTTHRMA